MLIIRNNRIYTYNHNNQSIDSYGIGLANLRQRYKLESGFVPEIRMTEDMFEVGLPILKKELY